MTAPATTADAPDSHPAILARAEELLNRGELDSAAAILDQVLAEPGAPAAVLATAVRLHSTIWAVRGNLARAADLYAWLHGIDPGLDAGVAASVFVLSGRRSQAQDALDYAVPGPPTDLAAAITALGVGATASVSRVSNAATPGSALAGSTALNTLTHAVSLLGSRAITLPVPPVLIAVHLCLHRGELARAGALLDRVAPEGIHARRYELLRAWIALLNADEDRARAIVDQASDGLQDSPNSLLAHGIRITLARRSGDLAALGAAWDSAQRVLDEVHVDLLSLLPLGEIWLGAVRMGALPRVAHLVEQARQLLQALGEPATWASTFHWYGVQAALLADDPGALVPHAHTLREAAEDPTAPVPDPYARTLAAAGRTWLHVMGGQIDIAQVESAAHALAGIGLTWDGARLAGEAALRSPDTATATALLKTARAIRGTGPGDSPGPHGSADSGPVLSEREGQVAHLIVLGLTQREVGEQLFISSKTVEHHVARIRRRIGAQSRSELLAALRSIGYGTQDRATAPEEPVAGLFAHHATDGGIAASNVI